MASLTQQTRVWANSGREGRTGKPGMLQAIGPQGVRRVLAVCQQHVLTLAYLLKCE